MFRVAAPLLALAVLVLAPSAYAAGYSGSCSTCAKATTGLPYTVPSWSFKTGCPRPSTYSASTGSAPTWAIPVGLCCGVEGYPPCPAISCAYSFSYSSSGPGQCASSYAVIKAASVSQTQYNADIKAYIVEDLKSYCATYPPTQEDVIAHAAAQASAMAEATATTLIYHNQMVCLNKFQYADCATCSTCAGGKAKTVVKAAVQAVANAAAEAWAGAYAEVLNSNEYDPYYGAMLASASADAAAVANAVNIAYDKFADSLLVKGSTGKYPTAASCKTDGPQTECKTAIAQVLTCVFVDALASVYTEPSSGIIQPDSTSCADSYSVSYSIGNVPQQLTCPYSGCAPLICDAAGPADRKPATCLEAKRLGLGDADGEFTLYLGADKKPTSIYCYQMDICTPSEWLTLKNVDSSTNDRTYNYLAYGPPGLVSYLTCNKPARVQYYLKVKLDVAALTIIADAVNPFLVNNGGGFYENDGCSKPNDNLHYGKAAGCEGNPNIVGRANIDLRGTGFSVSPTAYPSSSVGGFSPYSIGLPYVFSSGTQVVDLNAGGFCGFFGPTVLPLVFTS